MAAGRKGPERAYLEAGVILSIRGTVFTILVPGMVALYPPLEIDPNTQRQGGVWDAGWLPIMGGTLVYALCLVGFLMAGGTPAISLRVICDWSSARSPEVW